MTLAFGIGLMVGILIVIITVLIIKKKTNNNCQYDERQLAVRGQAFKAGFLTFVICQLAVYFLEIFKEEALMILVPGTVSMIVILLSLLVFIEVAIFKDAYFSPNKPFSKKWFCLMLILTVSILLRGFTTDDLWFKVFNLGAGAFMSIVLVSILIKMLISKKSDEEDEE